MPELPQLYLRMSRFYLGYFVCNPQLMATSKDENIEQLVKSTSLPFDSHFTKTDQFSFCFSRNCTDQPFDLPPYSFLTNEQNPFEATTHPHLVAGNPFFFQLRKCHGLRLGGAYSPPTTSHTAANCPSASWMSQLMKVTGPYRLQKAMILSPLKQTPSTPWLEILYIKVLTRTSDKGQLQHNLVFLIKMIIKDMPRYTSSCFILYLTMPVPYILIKQILLKQTNQTAGRHIDVVTLY